MEMSRKSFSGRKTITIFCTIGVFICVVLGISFIQKHLQTCRDLEKENIFLKKSYQNATSYKHSTQIQQPVFCDNKQEQESKEKKIDKFGDFKHTKLPADDPLLPVIVTAASSNHFLESQALIKNIHEVLFPRYGTLKIVYFDLGLKPKEREILEKYSNCELRIFPFEKYSPHLRTLNACTWKPKIILEMMIEYKFVMWADTSIRFKNTPTLIDDLLLRSMNPETPVLVIKGFPSMMQKTYLYTFQALNEDPEKYRNASEVGAGWVFARNTKFSLEKIMKPWSDCGLKYGCMGKGEVAGLCPKWNGEVGQCHRFDQSVIGIILNRIYNFDYDKFSFNLSLYIDIMREQTAQYFPKDIPKIKKQKKKRNKHA